MADDETRPAAAAPGGPRRPGAAPPDAGTSRGGATSNELSGHADTVVQAGRVDGAIHLHTSHLHASGDPAFPPPRQLPPDIPRFADRNEFLHALDACVAAVGASPEDAVPGSVLIFAIAGAAGIGKTALAVRWGHQARRHFPDGDLYVNLRGFDLRPPLGAAEALENFLRALGLPPERIPADTDGRAALFRSALDGKRMLIVLDNAATADQVRPLLPASPRCLVVVTSRHRLPGLAIREGAQRMTLAVLTPEESVALLRQVIGAERVDAEPAAAAELARRCGYLPLALRIVAERAVTDPAPSLAELVDELAAERNRLDALTVDDDLSAVRKVFSWSYRGLEPAEARLFRLLSLAPGPEFGPGAAAALLDLPVDQVRRLLGSLAGVHLLEQPARDRFRFHDLVRLYARERAEAEEPAETRTRAVRRVLAWYLRGAYAAYRVILPNGRPVPLDGVAEVPGVEAFADSADAVGWCERERSELTDAVRLAYESGEDALAWRTAIASMGFYERRSYTDDWVTTHRTALAAARRAGDRAAEAWVLGSLGDAHRVRRQYEDALACYEQETGIAREIGDRWCEGIAWHCRSLILQELRRFTEAADCSRSALLMLRQIADERGEGMALLSLATACRGLGRLPEADDHAGHALAIFRRIGNTWSEALARHTLGLIACDLRAYADAAAHHRAACAIFRALGDRQQEAATLAGLGEALDALGRADEARGTLEEAAVIFEKVDPARADAVRARLRAIAPPGP